MSHSHVFGSWVNDKMVAGPRWYIGGKRVTQEEYVVSLSAKLAADNALRKQREFVNIEDAFAYADSLADGVVLDWATKYAAMERDGLKIGFVISEWEQPVVTREDLLIRPAAPYILARRVGDRGGSTCFSDESQSWSESVYEVLEDSTGTYQKGQRLWTRLVPNESARPSIGRNWRMKLLRPEDIQAVLPPARELLVELDGDE